MKRTILALAAGAAVIVGQQAAGANQNDFRNKWPYLWNTSALIKTYPFSGVHGCYPSGSPPYECAAAYDLVIAGDAVASSAEGNVTFTYANATGCGSDLGYGNYVEAAGVRYAHLSLLAPSVTVGTHLLQGDGIGTQGATGNVQPCPGGKHLHWQFIGASSMPVIDGGSSASSNSLIGEYSAAGAVLRDSYRARGGWGSIGWTYKHCPGTCTLDMTAYRSWGRMQDFQHDADIFGGTFNTLQVSNYDPAHAYLVDSVFWLTWATGEATSPIGMAVGERGACPAGFSAACISYQPFYAGFVWMDAFTGRASVFCPDVDGDFQVTISDLAIAAAYYLLPAPAGVRAVDADGDGVVTINDLAGMAGVFGLDCRR